MYTLQAILLILKLIPHQKTLFSVGKFLHFYSERGIGASVDDGIYFYSYFGWISWWIILIPTYFTLVRAAFYYLKHKINNRTT